MSRQNLLLFLIATVCAAQPGSVPANIVCKTAPKVADCGNPPKVDGLYRLKSRAKLKDGRDLCLDVDTGSGRYQQLDCRNVPSSQFFFSTGGRPDHCYRIEQQRLGGRETTVFGGPDATIFPPTRGDIAGVGFPEVDVNCRATLLGIQWQLVRVPNLPEGQEFFQIKNEQTGQCMDADRNNLTPGDLITPQACQAFDNQFWMLFK